MHATIRRYEGVDQNRTDELTRKVGETLVPTLSKLPGFKGYYLIDDGKGVMSSFGIFETPTQADESTRIVASWVRDGSARVASSAFRPGRGRDPRLDPCLIGLDHLVADAGLRAHRAGGQHPRAEDSGSRGAHRRACGARRRRPEGQRAPGSGRAHD